MGRFKRYSQGELDRHALGEACWAAYSGWQQEADRIVAALAQRIGDAHMKEGGHDDPTQGASDARS